MRRATEVREKEATIRQKNLGFLHVGIRRAEPMPVWPLNALIARVRRLASLAILHRTASAFTPTFDPAMSHRASVFNQLQDEALIYHGTVPPVRRKNEPTRTKSSRTGRQIFARKIVLDAEHAEAGRKRLNIMKVSLPMPDTAHSDPRRSGPERELNPTGSHC